MAEVFSPFPYFTDLSGAPLDDGYVYIGTVGTDARANQITTYWDSALTQTAPQPIRTNLGYIMFQGAPSNIFVNASSYSIKVLDNLQRLVFEDKFNYPPVNASTPTGAQFITANDASSGAKYTTVQGFLTYLLSSVGSAIVGFIQSGTGATASTVQTELRREVWGEQFGMVGDGSTANATAFLNAIQRLRGTSVSLSTDGLGSGSITVYPSGTLRLGPGVFKIAADTISLTQDFGLKIIGSGTRGTSNFIRGATTLLITGTSSGYGIQVKGNGARMLALEDLDLCYETSGFTGSLLDIYSSPGVSLNRVYIGTYGISSGTRIQTAASCIRMTYDEFVHLNDVTMDGAVDGIWSDDTREPSVGFSTFGGSQTLLDTVTFYDFTGDMIRHDGNRTRFGLRLHNVSFNPISVDCVRSLDLNNVEALYVSSTFTPSVANKPTSSWMRLVNCTGHVDASTFDDLAPVGPVDGFLTLTNNRIGSTNGFELKGGVITAYGNEFSTGTAGYVLDGSPSYDLAVNLGPDHFKAAVTRSYDISADSASYSGRITYDRVNDASTSKFRNTTTRISIESLDRKIFDVSDATYSVSILDTGRHINATGGAAQTFTLPTPTPGCEIEISKISGQDLVINCSVGTNYYGVGTTTYTSATLLGTAKGTIRLKAYATVGWVVVAAAGTAYTFA